MVDLVERRRQVGVKDPHPLGARPLADVNRSPRSRRGSRGPAGTRMTWARTGPPTRAPARCGPVPGGSGPSAREFRAASALPDLCLRDIHPLDRDGLSRTRQTGAPAPPPRALASGVSATSPSIPAVLRPALRCVTCRTLTSVLARLRSISFCRFLTFGQSCSCDALKIRCRSRRTCSSCARQSILSHSAGASRSRACPQVRSPSGPPRPRPRRDDPGAAVPYRGGEAVARHRV